MSFNRDQVLDEMGLSPRWVVREHPVVARGKQRVMPNGPTTALPIAPTVVTPVMTPLPAEASCAVQSEALQLAGPERSTHIAQLGWESLSQSMAACRACPLCAERQQVVPGIGDQNADWLFIGEGPGAEEDAQGEPFVGPAGQLLDAMLAAIDLRRSQDVYIANAVKCRPPANRPPEAAELAACAPYLKRQIALLQPRLIVLLGRAAAQALLGEEGTLAGLRGKALTYREGPREIPVVVTYHPAYLLRTLPDKAKSWDDLCRARALMSAAKS